MSYNRAMKFRQLSEYFEKIEKTTLRNEKMEILAELLKIAEQKEVRQVVYLSLGRLRPKYDRLEFSIAEKMIVRVVAQLGKISQEEVVKEYHKSGDLGKVAELVSQGEGEGLTVREVYEELVVVAEETGSGSQERKVGRLSKLLARLDGKGAGYVVRMVLTKLRLGFSDKTVLDALSYMQYQSKEGRKSLDSAYQAFPDVGRIAQVVKESGIGKLESLVGVELGTPVMSALAQRVKTADEMIKKMGEVIAEPKFDGARCITGYTAVIVKNRGYVTARELRVGNEVLTHKGSFRKILAITKRPRKHGERIFELKSMMGDKLKLSEGHKVLVVKDEKKKWLPVEEITKEWLFYPRPQLKSYSKVERVKVFKDKSGYEKQINLNARVMQLLGYWVGDGFSNNYHENQRLGIVCNAKHKKIIDYYSKIIREELHIHELSYDRRSGAVMIYWRDPVMRKWLCKHFRGNKERGKRIPEWMLGIDKERWEAFLLGWKEADGSIRHGGGYKIITKERQMVMMGQVLCAKHGVPVGIRRIRVPINEKRKKTYYELIIPGTKKYWGEIEGGYMIQKLRLREIKKDLNHRVTLYDIQVDKDESFCVSIASLHNCQIHYSAKGESDKGKSESQGGLFQEDVKKGFVRTFTRNLDENSAMFPELEKIGDELQVQDVILDTEAVGYDPETGEMLPFQMTITRKRKHGIREAASEVPLKFYVFDIMYLNGKSLLNTPLVERREILEKVVGSFKEGVLVLDDYLVTSDPRELRKYHSKQLGKGLEGAMVKKKMGKYLPGRQDYNWVKFKEAEDSAAKLSDTLDVVVMGYYKGRGKRAKFSFGALLVGVREGEKLLTIAKIGTGISDRQFLELGKMLKKIEIEDKREGYEVTKTLTPDVWVEPEIIVEVAADEITKSPAHSSLFALRFPRLIRVRADKDLLGVTSTDEVREIGDLK